MSKKVSIPIFLAELVDQSGVICTAPWALIKGKIVTHSQGGYVSWLAFKSQSCHEFSCHLYQCSCVIFINYFRLSRGERSGRYGSDGGRDDPEWYDRRSRDVERDYDRRWNDDRHRDRFDDRRDRDRDSPEVSK